VQDHSNLSLPQLFQSRLDQFGAIVRVAEKTNLHESPRRH
jgi:hypothetical protein